MNPLTPAPGISAEHIKKVTDLEELIKPTLLHKPLEVVLSALLRVFVDGAISHPCCAQMCANLCFQAGMQIAEAAAQAPALGTPIH